MIGSILGGRYRVDSLIGAGGMANVYKAYDEVEKRTVAVKMLKKEHQNDAEFVRRFAREAQAVLSLSHPNIVSVYDVVEEDALATMKKPACLTLSWSMWKAAR